MSYLARLVSWIHPLGEVGAVVSLLVGAAGVWCFWRVHRLLMVLPAFEARTAALTTSVSLLTDTTEACFKTLSGQLQSLQAHKAAGRAPWAERHLRNDAGRGTRQRRVVSAVLRGETVAAVAAREQVAETEVALRLQLDGERRTRRKSREIPPAP